MACKNDKRRTQKLASEIREHQSFNQHSKQRMEIRILNRKEIDDSKWNGCVHYASNSKIYGYTWYLDNVGGEWIGMVEGDYQSVFPIFWNNKLFGLKQMFHPMLCQQLGIFSVNVCNKSRLRQFINKIPSYFKYWEIAFNDGNKKLLELENLKVSPKINLVLDLNRPYEELYKGYSKNIKRNIKKAGDHNLFLNSNLKPETFVAAVKKAQLAKGIKRQESLYHASHRIIYNCLHRGKGVILSAHNTQKELCAAIFFMFNGSDMINLLNVSTEEGKKTGAMAYLLNVTIMREAGKRKFIDFEGSSIEGIARFYKGFGAQNVPYFLLTNNLLPWWIKWRKK